MTKTISNLKSMKEGNFAIQYRTWGGRHSSVVSSTTSILRPWVRIRSMKSTLFQFMLSKLKQYLHQNLKRTKIIKKRPGLTH